MRNHERGAVNVVMVCAIVFGIGMGASVLLNFVQAQRASDDKAQLKGQIGDLTYQVDQDRKLLSNGTPTPTVSPSASPSPSPSPTAATSAKTIIFTELGVSVTAPDPVGDLIYKYHSPTSTTGAQVWLSSTLLISKYPKCIESYLGIISKRPIGQKPTSNEALLKSSGGSSYYYIKPIYECATDTAGKTLRSNLLDAITSSVLTSLK